ncbi:MAG: 4-hydroxy-tetrahydrodipicolinate reductase [Sandaracinaceae bacterium]
MTARVALFGANGRMGRAVQRVLDGEDGVELAVAVTASGDSDLGRDAGELAGTGARGVPLVEGRPSLAGVDVAVDFTDAAGTARASESCGEAGVPLVSGVTGLGPETIARLDELACTQPVVWAPNMSVGVTVLFHLAAEAARLLGPAYDAEIVEMHHRHKVDAPSGTAVRLAEVVAGAKGLADPGAAVHGRSGAAGPRPDREVGVMSLRGGEVIGDHTLHLAGPAERLELTHRAQDRSLFARGAVRAARWVIGQPAGRYGMDAVLGLGRAVPS